MSVLKRVVSTGPTVLEVVGAGKQSAWLSAGAWTPRVTNGAELTVREINSITVPVLRFSESADEGANIMIRMPKSWNASTVTVRPYWTATGGASAETLQFEVRGGCFANDAAINVTGFGTAVAIDDVWLADDDLHEMPESGVITLSNAAKERLAILEIIRDVSDDNLSADADFLGLMFHYTEDTVLDN